MQRRELERGHAMARAEPVQRFVGTVAEHAGPSEAERAEARPLRVAELDVRGPQHPLCPEPAVAAQRLDREVALRVAHDLERAGGAGSGRAERPTVRIRRREIRPRAAPGRRRADRRENDRRASGHRVALPVGEDVRHADLLREVRAPPRDRASAGLPGRRRAREARASRACVPLRRARSRRRRLPAKGRHREEPSRARRPRG